MNAKTSEQRGTYEEKIRLAMERFVQELEKGLPGMGNKKEIRRKEKKESRRVSFAGQHLAKLARSQGENG